MDRKLAATWEVRARARRPWGADHVVPSRAEALAKVQDLLPAGNGPILLTGDSGSGKTWLLNTLQSALPEPWRWTFVDLTAAVGPAEFYRLILHELGIDAGRTLAEARSALAGFLTDRSADGECWVAAFEESQSATFETLEEIRVLGNRLGAPEAFAGVVLSGQNSLIRRLSGPPLSPLAARLSGHVHLSPITVEELSDWVSLTADGETIDEEVVELLHRRFAGNARGLCAHFHGLTPLNTTPIVLDPPLDRAEASSRNATDRPEVEVTESRPLWKTALLPSAKPPLEVSEEMIEVGWDSDGDLEEVEGSGPMAPSFAPSADSMDAALATQPGPVPPLSAASSEEAIKDHYAALQAWTEWSRNHDPMAVEDVSRPPAVADLNGPDEIDAGEGDRFTLSTPDVRVEGEHGFAPFGQLFSRLRQTHDPR